MAGVPRAALRLQQHLAAGGSARVHRAVVREMGKGIPLGAKAAEPEFYGQFTDKTTLPLKVVKNGASNPDEIAAISGATITSTAVTDGVNAAVNYWSKNLKGGN